MRSAPGTKLAEITINENVVSETDGISSDEAWSVVVKGAARVLQSSAEIAEAESLKLKTWVQVDFGKLLRPLPVASEPKCFSGGQVSWLQEFRQQPALGFGTQKDHDS